MSKKTAVVSKLFVKCDDCNEEMECDLTHLPNLYLFHCNCGKTTKIQVIGKSKDKEY